MREWQKHIDIPETITSSEKIINSSPPFFDEKIFITLGFTSFVFILLYCIKPPFLEYYDHRKLEKPKTNWILLFLISIISGSLLFVFSNDISFSFFNI